MHCASGIMSASVSYELGPPPQVGLGVMGGVREIPPGFSMEHVIVASRHGINHAFGDWGRVVRGLYGKTRARSASDPTANYLGFITDNGDYYYYHTAVNRTYYDTMMGVYEYSKQERIPYRNVSPTPLWRARGEAARGNVCRPASPRLTLSSSFSLRLPPLLPFPALPPSPLPLLKPTVV